MSEVLAISVSDKPLRIAVVTGRHSLTGAERDLVDRIVADQRFHLMAVIEENPERVSPPETAGGSIAMQTASFVIAMERRFRRAEEPPQDVSTLWPAVDVIRDAAAEGYRRVRDLDLDLIVDITCANGVSALARAARFGVWSRAYGDVASSESRLPGFRAVSAGQGVTRVSLRQHDRTGERTVARAFYPTRRTYTSNINAVRESSVELVWRELKKLQRSRSPVFASVCDEERLRSAPDFADVTEYGARLGTAALKSALKRTAAKLGIATDRWSLFVGTGSYDTADWSRAIEVRPPAQEYWADPFLLRRKGDPRTHVFFEAFDYGTGKGKISVGAISSKGIAYLGDALDTGYHLSYPFVFEHAGDIWMIPESHETRRLELWRCVDYPLKWTLEKTVLEGCSLADSSLCQHDGAWWLFTNQAGWHADDHNSELHVFWVDSPMMNQIIPHAANPVVIDATRARNGGRIHRRNGLLMRPAQNNAFRYGYGLRVQRITTLTLDDYQEESFFSIGPDFRPGISCCHHLDSSDGLFVFDARLKFG